jgi:tRNA A37 threonylcarbamoyltransferase TsaD
VAFTVGLVLAVGTALVAALAVLIASPYLLVRHVEAHRAHRARQPKQQPRPVLSQRVGSAPLGSPQLKGVS